MAAPRQSSPQDLQHRVAILEQRVERVAILEEREAKLWRRIEELEARNQPTAHKVTMRTSPSNSSVHCRGNAAGKEPADVMAAEHGEAVSESYAVPELFMHLRGKRKSLEPQGRADKLPSRNIKRALGAAVGVRDGDKTFDQTLQTNWKIPLRKMLILACAYHVLLKMKKIRPRLINSKHFDFFCKQLQDLKTKCVVPSAVPTVFSLMIEEWKEKGEGVFAEEIDQYVDECGGLFSTLSIANLLSPVGGTPCENETIESLQRWMQRDCCHQQPLPKHVIDVQSYMQIKSREDECMKPILRTEEWGPNFFADVRSFMNVNLYPEVRDAHNEPKVPAINAILCGRQKFLPVCTLPVEHTAQNDTPGNLKYSIPEDIVRVEMNVLCVPTPGALESFIKLKGSPRMEKSSLGKVSWSNLLRNADQVRQELSKPCENGDPSWFECAFEIFRKPTRVITQRKWKFDDYIDWSDSFRYLIAVTDPEEADSILSMLEQGTDTACNSGFRFGGTINREKITPFTPVRRCLCEIFLRRRNCLCVTAYLISVGILIVPSAFDTRLCASPSKKGRPKETKDGDCWGPGASLTPDGVIQVPVHAASSEEEALLEFVLDEFSELTFQAIRDRVLAIQCSVQQTRDGRGWGLFAMHDVDEGQVIAILSHGHTFMSEPPPKRAVLMPDGKHYQQYMDPKVFYQKNAQSVNDNAKRGCLVNEPGHSGRCNCRILHLAQTKKRAGMTVIVATRDVGAREEFLTDYGNHPGWEHRAPRGGPSGGASAGSHHRHLLSPGGSNPGGSQGPGASSSQGPGASGAQRRVPSEGGSSPHL